MSEMKKCPNCNEELKSGLLSSNKLLSNNKISIINEFHESQSDGYCNKCGNDLHNKYCDQLKSENNKLTNIIKSLIHNVPVISTHSPLNWNYTILEMVTGQSTTGTGVISEFTSSFTDFLGTQSGRHNAKLKAGENLCFSQLRKQALDFGGNAVIATDIDYSELGALKGMIMVCMAGTAIKLNNPEVLSNEKSKLLNDLIDANNRFRYLSQYDSSEF